MKSTHYYNKHAEALSNQYNAIDAGAVHRGWFRQHLPEDPGLACDI
jgi:hypothetical protein